MNNKKLKIFEVKNIEDLDKIIECIKNSKKNIILLSGPLGSGKTTLVNEFVKKELGENATSPTFSLQNIYGDKIYHYDLYQKSDLFLSLGLIEELDKDKYHFIEWGDKIEDVLQSYGFEYMKIDIKLEKEKRIIQCQY